MLKLLLKISTVLKNQCSFLINSICWHITLVVYGGTFLSTLGTKLFSRFFVSSCQIFMLTFHFFLCWKIKSYKETFSCQENVIHITAKWSYKSTLYLTGPHRYRTQWVRAFAPKAEGWVFDSQPWQTLVDSFGDGTINGERLQILTLGIRLLSSESSLTDMPTVSRANPL